MSAVSSAVALAKVEASHAFQSLGEEGAKADAPESVADKIHIQA
jgi:hypothetical protein